MSNEKKVKLYVIPREALKLFPACIADLVVNFSKHRRSFIASNDDYSEEEYLTAMSTLSKAIEVELSHQF